MGLHDRLKGGSTNGDGLGLDETLAQPRPTTTDRPAAEQRAARPSPTPPAALDTPLHAASIPNRGPELAAAEPPGARSGRVPRPATQHLAHAGPDRNKPLNPTPPS